MNESLMPQGLDTWDDLFLDDETTDRSEFIIHDERLAERLGVEKLLDHQSFETILMPQVQLKRIKS